jgi:hypothetical protein
LEITEEVQGGSAVGRRLHSVSFLFQVSPNCVEQRYFIIHDQNFVGHRDAIVPRLFSSKTSQSEYGMSGVVPALQWNSPDLYECAFWPLLCQAFMLKFLREAPSFSKGL